MMVDDDGRTDEERQAPSCAGGKQFRQTGTTWRRAEAEEMDVRKKQPPQPPASNISLMGAWLAGSTGSLTLLPSRAFSATKTTSNVTLMPTEHYTHTHSPCIEITSQRQNKKMGI